MRKIFILALFLSLPVLATDLHTSVRQEWNTVDLDSSVNNIPVAPSSAAGSKIVMKLAGTGATLTTAGHSDHVAFCTTATTRVRVRYSDTIATAPTSSSAYNLTIPAAGTGSFSCVVLDDVQIGQYLYVWSAGSAISTGLFWAFGW